MAGELTLGAIPASLQTGESSTVTASVVDTNGDPMEGVEVSLAATSGALGSALVTTTADGTATTSLTSDSAGAVDVTAAAEGLSAQTTVEFTAPEEPEDP